MANSAIAIRVSGNIICSILSIMAGSNRIDFRTGSAAGVEFAKDARHVSNPYTRIMRAL
jgi:hypothetical protein